MLMLVAGLPVEICPVQSEARPASWEPCAARLLRPSTTMTLLCRLVVQAVPPTVPPFAKGASVLRKMKLLVEVAGDPYAGRGTDAPPASVAPQTGRTHPQGVKMRTMYVGAVPLAAA